MRLRELTVHKFRGSNFLQGKHEVEITHRGIQLHPRTEIQFDKPRGSAQKQRIRMGFGVKSLDDMPRGGPLSGSATALLGSPGTGKTFLGLSFLVEGARQGHCGIYHGFYEPPPRLIEKAESIGLPLKQYVDNGQIEFRITPRGVVVDKSFEAAEQPLTGQGRVTAGGPMSPSSTQTEEKGS